MLDYAEARASMTDHWYSKPDIYSPLFFVECFLDAAGPTVGTYELIHLS